jgi:acetyl-CoA carboxylase alpha subunit
MGTVLAGPGERTNGEPYAMVGRDGERAPRTNVCRKLGQPTPQRTLRDALTNLIAT